MDKKETKKLDNRKPRREEVRRVYVAKNIKQAASAVDAKDYSTGVAQLVVFLLKELGRNHKTANGTTGANIVELMKLGHEIETGKNLTKEDTNLVDDLIKELDDGK